MPPASYIADRDVRLLIWRCGAWSGIVDFRRTASRRLPRYEEMAVPFGHSRQRRVWITDPSAVTDSALTGDPLESQRDAYFYGGIMGAHSDIYHGSAEIRASESPYRSGVVERAADPVGTTRTHPIPGTAGKTSVIASDDGYYYSQRPHVPYIDSASLLGRTYFMDAVCARWRTTNSS